MATLGFTAEPHLVDYLKDATSALAEAVNPPGREPVAVALYRVGTRELGRRQVAFYAATVADWGERSSDRDRARRRIARALVDNSPPGEGRRILALFPPEESGVQDFELVMPRFQGGKFLGTVRVTLSSRQGDVTRHQLELLHELEIPDGATLGQIASRWRGAFDTERVTTAFYKAFRTLRNRFVEEALQHNRERLKGVRPEELSRFATRNLGRMLFLWFLQAKGWLNRDRHFFDTFYRENCQDTTEHNFFVDSLLPLFFDALAKKSEDRPASAQELGDIPYLNGGLFLPTAFEDDLYGVDRANPIRLPNDLFDPRGGDVSVLGLLNSYRFTTQESTPDNLSVDPDPELLGKVLENLNEKRDKEGCFYTPREIVRFMCRETLDAHLTRATGGRFSTEDWDWLRQEAVDPEADDRRLNLEDRRRIEKALTTVTVCDPAVGSGAFPVGMMQELVLLRTGLVQSTDDKVEHGGQTLAEWKEHIITHQLYGVDINPEAVEVCQLRLWLSLVIDAKEPMPLPNLDFRFVAGDSLVDRIGQQAIRGSLGGAQDTKAGLFDAHDQGTRDEEDRILRLKEEFSSRGLSPVRARELRQEIRELERNALRQRFEERLDSLNVAVDAAREEHRRLEQQQVGVRRVKKAADTLKLLEVDRDGVQAALVSLQDASLVQKPFLWPVFFPEVFEDGGFDIVVANPPYVRQESLSASDQQTYGESFSEVYRGTADLLVFFYGRALQILKTGGQLAFITSNKFMQAKYGDALRGYLQTTASLRFVIDFGDLPVFDAAAYPAVVIGSKKKPGKDAIVLVADLTHPIRRAVKEREEALNVASVREQLSALSALLEGHVIPDYPQRLLGASGWILENPQLVALLRRLQAEGTPLGDYVKGRMYYGIKTGHNEAFVIDQAKRDELVAADPKSAEIIKPFLRGRDIKRWKAERPGLYLIAVQNSGDADAAHAWSGAGTLEEAERIFGFEFRVVYEHLKPFRDALQKRHDKGRYWWELRACAYYEEFSQPMIAWPENTPPTALSFAPLDGGTYINNKGYFMPGAPPWLLLHLNSRLFLFLASCLATRIRGGYLEMRSEQVVGQFPVVEPDGETVARAGELLATLPSMGSEDAASCLVDEIYGITGQEAAALDHWLEVQAW